VGQEADREAGVTGSSQLGREVGDVQPAPRQGRVRAEVDATQGGDPAASIGPLERQVRGRGPRLIAHAVEAQVGGPAGERELAARAVLPVQRLQRVHLDRPSAAVLERQLEGNAGPVVADVDAQDQIDRQLAAAAQLEPGRDAEARADLAVAVQHRAGSREPAPGHAGARNRAGHANRACQSSELRAQAGGIDREFEPVGPHRDRAPAASDFQG
jgi:hypothetical protein